MDNAESGVLNLSDRKRHDLQGDTNKKVVGKFKCEANGLVIK